MRFSAIVIVVLDVTNVQDDLEYWVEFPQQQFKFVKRDEVHQNWPMLAIQYLEEHLSAW